ncbi:MAG: carboxymuconolactone decarboxylase family protein [Gemmataceae bacterium]
MSFLPSLPENPLLLDVFRTFPASVKPLIDYHQILLRGPSPLSIGERELIAAYVSGLNACSFCHGVHSATAGAFGIAEPMLAAVLKDVDTAPIDDRLKPILRYVKKLTRLPAHLEQADADAVYAAGWSEPALHDAVAVCALFNLMNRLVEGFGVRAEPDYFAQSAQRLAGADGYQAIFPLLDLDK